MSTTPSSRLSSTINSVLFLAGIFVGVSIFMVADVQLHLLSIERGSDPLPNMHPLIRYYFIPVIGAFMAIGAALLNLIVGWFHKISLPRAAWFSLGFGYSCLVSFLPFGRLLGEPTISIPLAILLSLGVVAFTRITFGTRLGVK